MTPYANGTPAACRLSVSSLDRELRTNRLGVAVIEIEPKGNQFQLIVVARDDQGRSTTAQ